MVIKKISRKSLINRKKYGKYFSMNYLIKYGYFDFKHKAKQSDEDYIISNILYKNVFNTNDLKKAYFEIKKTTKFNSKKETVPVELSVYKNEDERRIYKLPNIYSYICLCRHLSEKKDKYIEILASSDKSLSKEFYNSTFFTGKIKREENRIGKKRIFKTDIQNFYPSLYTHSIPWILVGKSEAKRTKDEKDKYYNALDTLIQRCQRGETHGLPTGCFASRLIAEIYMCKFDEKMSQYSYVRYVDDFELPFNDESEKGEFYKDLNKELNSLNLKIKVEKNQEDSFPFQDSNNSAFFFDYFTNNTTELGKQTKRIYNFIEESINKEREGHKGAIKLMFKALKTSVMEEQISQEALTKPMLKKLFNLVLMTPHLSVYFLEFIDILEHSIVEKRVKVGIEEIKSQIRLNIDRYIDLNFNQELYSLLSIFYYLNIDTVCSKDQLLKTLETMDDLSSILSFEILINNESNIDDFIFDVIERKLESSISWQDEYWLFKYHIFLRINEDKGSKLHKEYKNYIYDKYNNGVDRSKFFNQNNIKKIESPINLMWQNSNSEQDITTFFKALLEKKISFLNKR